MSVVSARKLAANRANAQASTGPRTAAGKARSARNAVKHGLSSPTRADPEVMRATERWGRKVAGETTGEERELAYAIAAAQVELERVRQARFAIYNADCGTARVIAAGAPAALLEAHADGIEALEERLCEVVWQLDALQRYDERAFARRQRAIRRLEDLRSGTLPKPPRLPRPQGLRLPRWRLPNPHSRVIKFEGLPRWAWWRPDPLDEPPKPPRPLKRQPAAPAVGELEALLRPELLFRDRNGAGATRPAELPCPVGERAGARGADDALEAASPRPSAQRAEGEQPPECVEENAAGADASTKGTGSGPSGRSDTAERRLPDAAVGAPAAPETQDLRETNPPSAPERAAAPPPACGPEPTAAAPAPEMQQPGRTIPRRWGATPTPLPTCRVGPCRWEGEMPADHWSYRSWRSLRPPGGSRHAPLGPPLRQRRTTAARSRAPP
jgi:hypothetical protein